MWLRRSAARRTQSAVDEQGHKEHHDLERTKAKPEDGSPTQTELAHRRRILSRSRALSSMAATEPAVMLMKTP
jgi:hypothetical protein